MTRPTTQLASSTPAIAVSSMSSSSRHARPAQSPRGRPRWDEGIPPILRPLVRAYLLGYASSVAPRLLTLLLQHLTRRRHRERDGATTTAGAQQQHKNGEPFLAALQRILRGGLDWQRFPTFCAVIVGGSTLLELPFRAVFNRLANNLSGIARQRLSRWFASFIAAWLSLRLLQSKKTPSFTDTVPSPAGGAPETVHYAGRTLDLTLFAVTRALDVIGGELWHRRKLRRQAASRRWTALEFAISQLTDPAIFAVSSGLIMWTWIYLPSRLPRAYNKWIGSAAAVDGRLIEALQRARTRTLRYGEDTRCADLLGSMCTDYGWPREWGDPARSVPFPCEMVHMGCGSSCEYHALSRFARSFRWAMATYLPLSLLLAVRNPNLAGFRRALVSAARSSAFLGAFITLFYYGVCLARTRVGPHVVGKDAPARQRIDGGICIGTGCLLCGWSIMIEKPRRRKDMALFVAPRALATLFPRRYGLDKQWRETLAFAFSTAVVFTCVLENRARVRGVLGGVLGSVLKP
ncbi:hypothetical protein MFIFM68171_03541 [Madurella fahalii]|uniref:Integral membrane protein n=1 Tax=Madurella fahalii TaxID=1157608 RepID=A0ABQ0G6G8_9PEZI